MSIQGSPYRICTCTSKFTIRPITQPSNPETRSLWYPSVDTVLPQEYSCFSYNHNPFLIDSS